MTVSIPIRSSPIYPCAVCARVVNALVWVGALDRGAVVRVATEADFGGHAVGVADFGVFGEAVVGAVEALLCVRCCCCHRKDEEKGKVLTMLAMPS